MWVIDEWLALVNEVTESERKSGSHNKHYCEQLEKIDCVLTTPYCIRFYRMAWEFKGMKEGGTYRS